MLGQWADDSGILDQSRGHPGEFLASEIQKRKFAFLVKKHLVSFVDKGPFLL